MGERPSGPEAAAEVSGTSGRPPVLTRRRVLIGLGAGAGALLVGAPVALTLGRPSLVDVVTERGTGPQETPESAVVWFAADADGITFYVPKVEMGQGIHTTLALIAAEELELDPTTLTVVQADTARGFPLDTMFTFGSSSVTALFTPIREAAATLREMLRIEAARQLGVDPAEVTARNGTFVVTGTARSVTYQQVADTHTGDWAEPADTPPLKPVAEFARIGRTTPRVDFRAKVLGEATYGYDARLDGMLFGAVAHPPTWASTLDTASEGTARNRPGVVEVVIDKEAGFVGVVADTRTRAWRALEALDLAWSVSGTEVDQAEIDQLVTPGQGAVIRREGSVRRALSAGTVVEADYRTPLAAHAQLEPVAALVDVAPGDNGTVRVWAATQTPDSVISGIQEALGKDREVLVQPTQIGGSFGRKTGVGAAVEAARLSAAVGRPVHVGWTREDDLRQGYYRPPTHTRLRGSVGDDGRIRGIEQLTGTGDIIWAVAGLPELVRDLLGFDPGGVLGQFLPYALPAYRVVNRREQLPVPTGPWRGLGLFPNTFALESFVDELALAAGADPLRFRLDHLPDTEDGRRLRAVLERAGVLASWGTPLPAGRGRGIACSLDLGTAVAQVAEVEVVDDRVMVRDVKVAVDCGLVVNPAGATLQAQGSVVMGLSSTLREELTVLDGMIEQTNLDSYQLLRLGDTPPIEVVFIEGGDEPRGMGEPVIGPVAAAVANAVAAATGRRLRQLPLRL
ncbi:MAG TPA: molybdopterin cofactor-binding domain-containing protein [Microlunatus sp.]